MTVSRTIYRADHCGSLIRPQKLRDARLQFRRGKISEREIEAIENEAILDALKLQREAGLKIYSDGEFRRDFWRSAVSDEFFEGMDKGEIDLQRYPFLKDKNIQDPDNYVPPTPIASGKIKLKKRITAKESGFLKTHSPGPYKATIPGPVTLPRATYKKGVTDQVYPTWEEMFADYTAAVAQEISAMVDDDGVTYLQIDAPHHTRFVTIGREKELIRDRGSDIERQFKVAVDSENICLRAAKRPGVTTAVHICLGTFILGAPGPLGGAGEYDPARVARLIDALDADVFLIEYSERTGSLESFRELPKNKIICLGILNTRDPRVETPDEIKRRVDAAAKYVPMENLTISPNCGFSGAAVDTWVTEDIEKRKLAVMVETADRLWG